MAAEIVYLGLGSNLGGREAHIRRAVDLVGEVGDVRRVSSLYETRPVGVERQPPFLNAAASLSTHLEPHALLQAVKEIERRVGRLPTYRWGPRVVDIDILLYGDRVVDDPDLHIPHALLAERAFALEPLAEIAPDARHPVLHQSIAQLAAGRPDRDEIRLRKRWQPADEVQIGPQQLTEG